MEVEKNNITAVKRTSGNSIYIYWAFINEELLKECHKEMDGKKAVEIDGITKEDYDANLEENLDELVRNMKRIEKLMENLYSPLSGRIRGME